MSDDINDIFPTARRRPSEPSGKVLLEFGSFREFIDDYSPYISPEGMFLLDSAHQPGEQIAFEVRLSDDFRLIHGTGEIAWTVPEGSPGLEAGAALRFSDLDEPSRRLVSRLVDNYRGTGGEPFDVDRRPELPQPSQQAQPSPSADSTVEPGAGSPAPEPELPPGMPMSTSLGTETIALPVSLAGLAEKEAAGDDGEASEPEIPGPEAEAVVEPDPEFESTPAAPAGSVRLADSAEPAGFPAAPAASGAVPGSADFEPADLVTGPDEVDTGAIEEALPVMPLDSDPLDAVDPELSVFDLVEEAIGSRRAESGAPEPAAAEVGEPPLELAAEPLPPAEPDAVVASPVEDETNLGTEPAPIETPTETPAETPFEAQIEAQIEAPVEMPDDEDLTANYYRTSGPKRSGRTRLWLAVCLLAVLLGAAAWRYKDTLLGYLPASMGGADATRTASVPAEPAAAVPEPVADPAAEEPAAGALEPGEDATQGDPEPVGDPGGEDEDPATAAAATEAVAEPRSVEPVTGPTAEPAPSVAEPASAAAPPTASPTQAGAPSQVSEIMFRAGEGTTEVFIVTNGALSRGDFEIVRVAEPPARQVIKLYGPETGYSQGAIAVGSQEVRRLRTGFHRTNGRGEVHVVADLTGPAIEVLGTDLRGSTLVITFGSR